MSGFDKYFQIAPCFRDEDARADRSPGEFYQLDIEMSFVEQEDIFKIVEPIFYNLFTKFGKDKKINKFPFPRIKYHDALEKYGTDKPDLRNPIEIINVTKIFKSDEVKLKIFKEIISNDLISLKIICLQFGSRGLYLDLYSSFPITLSEPCVDP